MIRNIYIAFLLLVTSTALVTAQEDFRKMAPKPGPAPQIELGDYEEFTLDNGLKVIVVENDKLPRVSFQLFVDVPLRKEGELAGTSDMMGGLLRSGTQNRSKAEIDEAIDFIGANLSTNANGLFATSLSKHKDQLLKIMAEVLLQPSFPVEEFEKLKKQTLSGLAQAKEDPSAIASTVAATLRYGDHPYGDVVTEETVENITLDKVKAYYNTYFKPNASYLVMVGDIEKDDAKKLARTYFGEWKKGEFPREKFSTPKKPATTQVDMVDRPTAVQSIINITYPVNLKPGTPEVIHTSILNMILGSSFNGRLFANLREDKGYTYGAYSSISPDPHVAFFNASASVRNEVTDSAIVQFLYELERIRTEKVSEAELRRAKSMITGSFARQLENPQTVARFALNTARYNLPEDYYANYLKMVENVSVADVAAAAERYITPGQAHIFVVGSKDEVGDKIARFAATGEIKYYDAFGRPQEMSTAEIPSDLTAQKVLDQYIKAIGGKEKLAAVKDVSTTMSTSAQGMTINMDLKQKASGKMAMSVNANGMVMNDTRFDGTNAKISAMGAEQPIDDTMIASLKEQAVLFPEMKYAELGYQMELSGVENIDGKSAYVLSLVSPSGTKMKEYYDAASGLKLRSVAMAENGQAQTSDYADYKAVDGIMFPHTTVSTGMAPIPLTLKVEKIEVNKGLDDNLFDASK